MYFTEYCVDENDTILNAITIIDKNKKGFAIVLNSQKKVCGVFTDGDARRALIKGAELHDTIKKYQTTDYLYIVSGQSLGDVIEYFKDKSIKFLPIVDKEKTLINLITKPQLHSLLLQDINFDLSYDFLAADEGIIDYEIYTRPLGFYKTTILNNKFQSKINQYKTFRKAKFAITQSKGGILDSSERNGENPTGEPCKRC